jgi:hypothetical protein
MRSTTNLAWPITPFGAGQRPFGKNRPMTATIAVGWADFVQRPIWACAVYLTTDSTRTLSLDGRQLNFGFEVLTRQDPEPPTVIVQRLDSILVACRRQAKVLAGHELDADLARLAAFATERRLPGVDTVRQQWTDRANKGRSMARMFDTAHDLGQPDVTDLAGACDHAALKVATIADPDGSTAATTVRQALTRTLAIALIAARAAGKYDWTTPVDLDELVTDATWDQLDQLDNDPSDAGAP